MTRTTLGLMALFLAACGPGPDGNCDDPETCDPSECGECPTTKGSFTAVFDPKLLGSDTDCFFTVVIALKNDPFDQDEWIFQDDIYTVDEGYELLLPVLDKDQTYVVIAGDPAYKTNPQNIAVHYDEPTDSDWIFVPVDIGNHSADDMVQVEADFQRRYIGGNGTCHLTGWDGFEDDYPQEGAGVEVDFVTGETRLELAGVGGGYVKILDGLENIEAGGDMTSAGYTMELYSFSQTSISFGINKPSLGIDRFDCQF